MKQFLSIASMLFLTLTLKAQQEVIISNQNGFQISYKSQKLSDGSKDKWLVTVLAINNTQETIYYGVPTIKSSTGTVDINPLTSQFSSKVTVRNATGFLASSDVKIKGENSSLFTENKAALLLQYEPGRMYNYENTFNLKHGDTPIITVSHNYQLKKVTDFDIETSSKSVDGDYKTTCGNGVFSLTLKDENGKTYLVQTVNGKQVKWIKQSSTQFAKEIDNNTTLSYNKVKQTFLYSSSDGINCDWIKQ